MSETGPLFETSFAVAAALNMLILVFFSITLYWIYKSPRVNKKLFLAALGIFLAPIVVALAHVLISSGDFLLFLGMILILPFIAAYIAAGFAVEAYYGVAYASLLVIYLLTRRKRSKTALPIKQKEDAV